MATYFHGNSDIHGGGDGLQTLILMNPAYVGYSDAQHQLPPPGGGNFVFLSPNSSAGNTVSFSHPPLPGVPTSAAAAASPHHQDVSELHGFLPRFHYNLHDHPAAAREVTRSQQGLSLSLSSQQQTGYRSFGLDREAPSRPLVTAGPVADGADVRVSGSGMQSAVLGCKYLKAAQELLEEVAYVGRGANNANEPARGENGTSGNIAESSSAAAAAGDGQGGGEGIAKRGAELTAAEKQEIQTKKAKLVNMLDEVEQRYKQYNQQMQIIISLFEQIAGIGSAKTYTALALQTISKQFRCLKVAILGQIRVASKSLGEEDHSFGGKIEGGSTPRLKYVDNHIRQQRALQQLGMIQHNAWRPQRGLPERSVSVLRSWLFEHFLHPYPKDSDKHMLAKQTGLTRSQVSNWFINARVRLWKPMVEEMYAEEMKQHQENGSDGQTTKTEHKQVSNSKHDNPTEPSQTENITQGSPKKQRNNPDALHSPNNIPSRSTEQKPANMDNEQMSMKFDTDRRGSDGFTITGAPTNFIGGFGSYPIVELSRFGSEPQFQAPYSSNGVSLTLGLPHCENLSVSGGHQTFLPNESIQLGRGVEIEEANGFGSINTTNW